MLLPVCHQQPLLPPKALPDRIFPPFLIPRTVISLRRASFVVCSSSSDRKTLPQSAIQRIADKLRTLGFAEETNHDSPTTSGQNSPGEIFVPLPDQLPIHRVGHTIDTSWSTPSYPVPKPGSGTAISRYHELKRVWKKEKQSESKNEEKVPSLAELTLPAGELRRLRSEGIRLTKKIKIGKAGITEGIVNGIHERWRTTEVVKIFCEDISGMNMKRTHDVLETKTGGLVIWRSGSKILLYRGVNYHYPYFVADGNLPQASSLETSSEASSVGDSREKQTTSESSATSVTNKMVNKPLLIQGVGSPDKVRFQLPGEVQLVEEADRLLEGLGPRFTDWWAYDPLPVDGDLLPAIVPEYRRPFRLLPYGVSPKLTDDEMTILRRLGRPLPCHFALGRNRNLQGLAVAIVKLWEKCEVAKIAVKRGAQNTNSELMAEELKWLTGGTLISRDKDFIVLYRGKDFLPSAVSSAIEERRRQTMIMDKSSVHGNNLTENEVGIEAQAITKDRQMKPRQRKSPEAILERTSIKLSMALEKKANAERILAELESRESPQQSDIDKEGITEDEKYMLRKIGLKMKPFLLLGRRGVFDGTIENMHLHWKYRELVKIICHEHSIEAAYEVAEILEAESGGILVAVEMVSKGYAIIVYRGKNYERPSCLRPQTLLSKREALKRSVEAQRRRSLKLHVLKLSNNIDELNRQLVEDSATNDTCSDGEPSSRMVQEETENQNVEPEKSRGETELSYSSDSTVPSSGEENWGDDSEDEVNPLKLKTNLISSHLFTMAASASSLALSTFTPKSLPFSISRPASASLSPPSLSFNLHSLSASLSLSISAASSRFVRNVAVTDDFSVEEDGIFADDDAPPPPRREQSFSSDLKLFVGNLPFNVDSAQLAQLFESAGNVEMVEVIYDKVTGRSRGFGFVTMSSASEVQTAEQQFNGYELDGRPLRVNAGPPPPKREDSFSRGPRSSFGSSGGGYGGGGGAGSGNRVYVGNLSWGVDDMALESLFGEQGKVVEARVIYDRDSGRSKGFGFVTYNSAQEVQNAIRTLDGADLDGRQIRVSEAEARPPRRQF